MTTVVARPQNRDPTATRAVSARIEDLDRVDASARFAFGTTAALVSISGPIEARLGVEAPSKATLEIHVRPLGGVPGVTERSIASILRNIFSPSILLNAHPRTLIQVVFQVLGSPPKRAYGVSSRSSFVTDYSMLAALINAGSLAFLRATSLPLTGVIVAVSVGVVQDGLSRDLVVDPEDSELEALSAGGTFAFLTSQSQGDDSQMDTDITALSEARIVWYSWEGEYIPKEFSKAEKLARHAASGILQTFRETLFGKDVDPNASMITS
ncbi:exosome non-catalytic core subunit rrp46 [Serendipita sp. 396]|nr:exosome non-catalytic core subunit rrp46 [Serendipita sp. 396]